MEYNEFEKKMMALTPVMPGLDPAAAAFEAGYRKGRRTARVWQVSSGGMALLLVMLSVYVVLGTDKNNTPGINGIAQFASVDNTRDHQPGMMINTSYNNEPVRKLNENSYLLLRNKVLEQGIDALPKSTGGGGGGGGGGRVYTIHDVMQG